MSDMECYVTDDKEGFARNFVEVVVGQRTRDGLLVERVEPVAVSDRVYDEKADRLRTTVEWATVQRVISRDHRGWDGTIEQDPVSYRMHRSHVREVALALLAYTDGDKGGPPGDASALRRDLDAERAAHAETRTRLHDLTMGVLAIAEREPLVIDPVIVE